MVLPALPPPRWLRFGLIAVAAIETLAALLFFPALFVADESASFVAQALNKLRFVLGPPLAGAALYFAIRGNVPRAVILLASLGLVAWAGHLPEIADEGPGIFSAGLPVWQVAIQKFVNPVAAALAIMFALQNRHIVAAAILASLPTIGALFSLALFGVGIMLFGS